MLLPSAPRRVRREIPIFIGMTNSEPILPSVIPMKIGISQSAHGAA
jgi:hypothetical protein